MSASDFWAVGKKAANAFMEDKASRLGAVLAFYAVFSIAPLLVISIGVAGLVFGKDVASHQIISQVEDLVGREGADAVATMVESASKTGSGVGTALGVLMLVVGASFLFGALQDALDTIWEVQPKPGRGIAGYLRDNLLSMSMVFGVAFLLLVSLVISAGLAAVGSMIGGGKTGAAGMVVQFLVELVALTPLFGAVYRVLPDARIAWNDVWFGAIVTAVLFIVGKFLIGFYLGAVGGASAYGAVGSLAVLLLWLYYASQIFLFGAELTKAYASLHGSRLVPKPHAEPVTAEARAQQGIPKQEESAGARVSV
jgi:membrane protein